MLRTHLGLADIAASSTDKFLRVESVPCPRIKVAPSLPAKVGLAALEADVVGVALHGKARRVVEPPRPLCADSLTFGQTLVLKTHQSFLSHILMKSLWQQYQGLDTLLYASFPDFLMLKTVREREKTFYT